MKKELHVYTNVDMTSSVEEFRTLFAELFKPSEPLKREIKKNLNAIGCPYVSLSFRFTHLLGDAVDEYMPELDEDSKTALMCKMVESIKRIRENHPHGKLLVNTDSDVFRRYLQRLSLPFVYMTEGIPVHIDQVSDVSENSIMKTFLDFYMISKAEKVFLVKDCKMYNSAFPRFAAAIGSRPYSVIEV